jgi:Uma2 family endonuclease
LLDGADTSRNTARAFRRDRRGYNRLMERDMRTATQEWPRRHRITVEQYYRMGEVGLFAPDERTELIDGEIIDMAPIGASHAYWVERLGTVLSAVLDSRAIVRQQLPVRLGLDSEPQPDVAVVTPRADYYRTGHPTAADVLLLVEISHSTLRFDRQVMAPFYARHGIPELWIVDLIANELQVHREPHDGVYGVATAGAFGPRALAALPDVVIDLAPLA